MRILITGSRSWNDYGSLIDAIVAAVQRHIAEHPVLQHRLTDWVTVVHGACPTGADAMADGFCRHVTHWNVEAHPADWSKGRSAGFERNAAMVSLGADVCLAFISGCTSPRCHKPRPHPSHGASHTADLAEKAGIPTYRFLGAS